MIDQAFADELDRADKTVSEWMLSLKSSNLHPGALALALITAGADVARAACGQSAAEAALSDALAVIRKETGAERTLN